MAHRLAAVEHLRRYPATTLDRRTLTILREQLTAYLTDYETFARRMLDEGPAEEYRREFEGEVADVEFCMAEIKFALARQDQLDEAVPAKVERGREVHLRMIAIELTMQSDGLPLPIGNHTRNRP